ncbi:YitT family protein [Kineococcus indalonis]|uniref:YitT family protein n=1 Tax=Kineococcus indalonis TaxID=2696566 RepID=UPI001413143A|nr:YitT family protein [Kineococcus indalonis]
MPPAPPHTPAEDVAGFLVGTFLASFGLFLLHSSTAVTGGTAGLGLLLSYALPVPFGVLFPLVNLPFFLLAVRAKGWGFTLRSAAAVLTVSLFSPLHAAALPALDADPVYAVLLGDLAAGLGILVLFRHRASLGGFGILALVLQERLGWRAGYVQMALDVLVVAASLAVVPPAVVALSAAGAVVLNLVLSMNHRPGRYTGTGSGS